MFKNKEGKVRSGWKIAGVTAVFLGVVMIFTILSGIVTSMILLANGDININTLSPTDKGAQILKTVELGIMFVQQIAVILTCLIAWKYIIKRPLFNMGLSKFNHHKKDLFVGLLFGAISMSIVFIILVLTKHAFVLSWRPTFSTDTFIYLILFILVGFAEEIYGRGFVMSALRQTRNVPVVVIVSSIIFALLHSGNTGIAVIPYLNLMLVGVLFAYMYLKSGNIWMCIGYHITWNYFQGNVFGFLVSGISTNGIITTVVEKNNLINGGDFGPEGGLIVTIILIIGFLFVKHFYRNSEYNFLASESSFVTTYDDN